MSVLIKALIPPQAFELIRDRVCQILVEELGEQSWRSGLYEDLVKRIYMERMVPFNYKELPALNVRIERGDYPSQHQGQAEAVYRYFIECNVTGETDDATRGDEHSKTRVHRLLGLCRAILEDPQYRTLGFTAGQLISHRHIESFVFAEPTRDDMEYTTMGQLVLVVKCVEVNALLDADLISSWETTVKLHDSEQGYYWSKQIEDWILETGFWDDDGVWGDDKLWID